MSPTESNPEANKPPTCENNQHGEISQVRVVCSKQTTYKLQPTVVQHQKSTRRVRLIRNGDSTTENEKM